MKALKLFAGVFAVCFVAGLAVVLVTPTSSLAIDCGQCYVVDCGPQGTCPPGQLGTYRYYEHYLGICEGPFDCKAVQIGCQAGCW
jgi:hypothetical protein